MRLPTQEEINIYNSLDEASAVKHFYNKTLEEAESLFRENSLLYQEDLMWMGPRAFDFYLQAVINYLHSDASEGDDDIVAAMYMIIQYRSTHNDFPIAIDNIRKIIDYVIDHYAKFEVTEKVHGDLLGKYKSLRDQLKAVTVNGD